VNLWLKSTGSDAGLQATITEVRPDGQEVYVNRGWLTASQRKLDEQASTPTMPVQTHREADVEPLESGKPTRMRIEVFPFEHIFRAGSRIRVIIDTPSQTGGWNWQPVAGGGVNSILHDAEHPSELVLSTMPGAGASNGHGQPACDTVLNQPCRADAFTASAPAGVLDWPRDATPGSGSGQAETCRAPTGRLGASRLGPARLGRTRAQVRRAFREKPLLRHRRHVDVFCLARGGIRVGYATAKLAASLPRARRSRIRGRAVLALTANGRYRVRGIRAGSSLSALRRAFPSRRRYRIGRNTWYLASSGRTRVVLRVRGRRVRAIGIANRRMTRTRRVSKRLLRECS
jgi:hypothetical protein